MLAITGALLVQVPSLRRRWKPQVGPSCNGGVDDHAFHLKITRPGKSNGSPLDHRTLFWWSWADRFQNLGTKAAAAAEVTAVVSISQRVAYVTLKFSPHTVFVRSGDL
jgi:hypothetical protein